MWPRPAVSAQSGENKSWPLVPSFLVSPVTFLLNIPVNNLHSALKESKQQQRDNERRYTQRFTTGLTRVRTDWIFNWGKLYIDVVASPLIPRRRLQASTVILSISVPALVSVYVGCQSVISLSEQLYKSHTPPLPPHCTLWKNLLQ